MDNLLFLDEANKTAQSIFCLDGLIISGEKYENQLIVEINCLKRGHLYLGSIG